MSVFYSPSIILQFVRIDYILKTFKKNDFFSPQNSPYITQERLDEMTRVSSSLTMVLGSSSALGMQQR